MSKERLRDLIQDYPGSWDDKVGLFACSVGRSKSTVYRWLTSGAPENVLDAIEFRQYLEQGKQS